MGGTRPQNRNGELVECAAAPDDSSLNAAGGNPLAYYRMPDRGDAEGAAATLGRALAAEELPAILQNQVLAEAAFFEAYSRGDPAAGRSHLEKVGSRALAKRLKLRAEAAALLAEGHRAEDRKLVDEALEQLQRSWDPGSATAEKEWLKDLQARTGKVGEPVE